MRQRADFQLVAELDDGRAALAAIERERPDVAVVDARLPGLDGARVLNAVVRDGVPTRVLLMSSVLDSSAAYDALAAGAAGWLSRAAGEGELCAAILAAANGEISLTADAQTAIAAEIRRRGAADEPLLSDRERLVLGFIADGWSASQIGEELCLSTGSVKSSMLKLYRRLGVSERAAAVAVAMRRGLIR